MGKLGPENENAVTHGNQSIVSKTKPFQWDAEQSGVATGNHRLAIGVQEANHFLVMTLFGSDVKGDAKTGHS